MLNICHFVIFPLSDALECKRAVKWLCDYIVTQCSRPPPAHSKDLHSSIVAAFQALVTWLVHHPYLLQDKECLPTVLEVAELGISGTKSQNKASDPAVVKEDKELSPASRRVRDAAEHLLSVVLEQVGYFPSSCGAESLSTLLDEASLLSQCNSWSGDQAAISRAESVQAFRYFVIDQSVILGILEEPMANDQEAQPTVTVLIRCPSNKAAWTVQLRHLPRHKSGQIPGPGNNPGRPMAMDDQGVRNDTRPCFFPDSIDRIPLCAADKSIPAVESISGDERAAMELERLSRLVESQGDTERDLDTRARADASGYRLEAECQPPEPCTEFQTARLILSHLGFLSLPALRAAVDSPVPRLVVLDNDSERFVSDLDSLDRIGSRTQDTLLVYYVRSGQSRASDIVTNARSADLSPLYSEMLTSLGWPVSRACHAGWTGSGPRGQPEALSGPGRYNGDSELLYWADVMGELAILVPTSTPDTADSSLAARPSSAQGAAFLVQDGSQGPDSGGYSDTERLERAPTSLSLELGQEDGSRRKVARGPGGAVQGEHRVVVAWLESVEDAENFPLGDLVASTNSVCLVVFVHPLASGLLRIKLAGQIGK